MRAKILGSGIIPIWWKMTRRCRWGWGESSMRSGGRAHSEWILPLGLVSEALKWDEPEASVAKRGG